MGDRGPKRLTKTERALKGSQRRATKAEKSDVQESMAKLPTAPKYLDRVAGAEWRRAGRALISMGKLTLTNYRGFEAYCYNYGLLRETIETLKTEASVLEAGNNSYKMPHPAIAVGNKAQTEMRYWMKFLLETKGTKSDDKKDPLQDFLNRGGKLQSIKK